VQEELDGYLDGYEQYHNCLLLREYIQYVGWLIMIFDWRRILQAAF